MPTRQPFEGSLLEPLSKTEPFKSTAGYLAEKAKSGLEALDSAQTPADPDAIVPTYSPLDYLAEDAAMALGNKAISSAAKESGKKFLADEAGSVKLPTRLPFEKSENIPSSDPAQHLRNIQAHGMNPNEPLFTGGKGDFTIPDKGFLGSSTKAPSAKQGFFFTPDERLAQGYAKHAKTMQEQKMYKDIQKLEVEKERLYKKIWDESSKTSGGYSRIQEHPLWDKYESIQNKLYTKRGKFAVSDFGVSEDERLKIITSDPRIAKLEATAKELTEKRGTLWDKGKKQWEQSREFVEAGNLKQAVDDEKADLIKKIHDEIDSRDEYVQKVLLRKENPFIKDMKGKTYREESYNDILLKAKAKGHDSAIIKNTYDPAQNDYNPKTDVHVVFDPEQIRSVDAAFDPKKKHLKGIFYSEGGNVQNFAQGGVAAQDDPYASIRAQPPMDGEIPVNETHLTAYNPKADFEAAEQQRTDALQERFGTPHEQSLAVLEGFSRGLFSNTLTSLAEQGLVDLGATNASPEAQRGRQEANPWSSGLSEFSGFTTGIFGPQMVGKNLGSLTKAGALTKLGTLGTKATGLGEVATHTGRFSQGAVRGLIEGGLYQADNEIAKKINEDPNQTADSVVQDIGLMGLFGAITGGAFGLASPLWTKKSSPVVTEELMAFQDSIDGNPRGGGPGGVETQRATEALDTLNNRPRLLKFRDPKENAEAIKRAAQDNNWPVFEGQISNSKDIQKMEASLLKGPPTFPSVVRKNQYNNAYQQVSQDLDNATAAPLVVSEQEAGQELANSLLSKLEKEKALYTQLYEEIAPFRNEFQVDANEIKIIKNVLKQRIKANDIVEGTPEWNFVKMWSKAFEKIENLEQLAKIRTALGRGTTKETYYPSKMLKMLLDDVEEHTIRGHIPMEEQGFFPGIGTQKQATQKVISGLIEKIDSTNAGYSEFRDKMRWLGEKIGKKKIHGPQDFLDFIENLNPQVLMKKIFEKGNTKFAQEFEVAFPDEMKIIKSYHRAEIKNSSMVEDKIDVKKFYNKILKLPKEMHEILYSPEELKVIKDTKTWVDSLPKDFNPSGTAYATSLMDMMASPYALGVANFRDAGMLAAIKAMGASVTGAEKSASTIIPSIGKSLSNMSPNAEAFKDAVTFTTAVIKSNALMAKAAKSIFDDVTTPIEHKKITPEEFKKIDEEIKSFQVNPERYERVGGKLHYYMTNSAISMKQVASNVVNYLSSIRPKEVQLGPLDKPIPPGKAEEVAYRRAVNIAEDPLLTVKLLKNGQLTAQDVTHLKSLYPLMYSQMVKNVMDELSDSVSKGKRIPHELKQALSTFMGQPMDFSVMPQSVMSNQATFTSSMQQENQNNQVKPTSKGMSNITKSSRSSLNPKDEE